MRSLTGRLFLLAALVLVLGVAMLWALFTESVEAVSRDVVDTRILEFADQVRGHWVSVQADGAADGTFTPVTGSDLDWVWQVTVEGEDPLRSDLLMLSGHVLPGTPGLAPAPGFALSSVETDLGLLRVAERVVDEATPFAERTQRLHYVVGLRMERYLTHVQDHATRFENLPLVAVTPVALLLLVLALAFLMVVRRDLGRLTSAIARYEKGENESVEGRFSTEFETFAERLNAVLRQNAKLVERTRKYVSKIAHDINHPLAIMKNGLKDDDLDRDRLGRQVERMVGLVDRYTSLARAIGPEGQQAQRTPMAEVLDDVVTGFSILYRRDPLEFETRCEPADLTSRVPRHDLEAMASNLVSNAHKHAETRVLVSAVATADGALELRVEDDGPGIPDEDREAALNWGKRLDEAPPGTGFGLSIVQDIADLHQGRLVLERSELGGLSASVVIPGAG